MILPLVVVYAATRAFWWAVDQPWLWEAPLWAEGALKVALWVPSSIILVMVLRSASLRDALGELGLATPAWRGTVLVMLATLPMIGFLLSAGGWHVRVSSLLSVALLGPLAEEVLYRGFFFQQLWQRARWPVWIAALASAVVFAIAHHQDLDITLTMGLLRNDLTTPLVMLGPPLLSTIAGGCLFAWLTWRWRSLWPAIAAHGAINFWWDVTPAGANPTTAALAQGVTLALMVGLTWARTAGRGVSSPRVWPPVR